VTRIVGVKKNVKTDKSDEDVQTRCYKN